MNYCYIGTETIIHLLTKKLFSYLFFVVCRMALSFIRHRETHLLVTEMQKYTKKILLTIYVRILYIRTCIGDLIGGHGPICMDEQDREFLCTRAPIFLSLKTILSV
jgi:hypothetical protein